MVKETETKQQWQWYFASLYLETLRPMGVMAKDKGFKERYDDLMNYVNSKLLLPHKGDIIDTYIVVKQRLSDEETSDTE